MDGGKRAVRLRFVTIGLSVGLALATFSRAASGQGCMPLHFTSATLGGQQAPFLLPHEWQVGVAARRVASNRVFLDSHEDESVAPGGQPLYLRLNSLDLSASYGLTEQLSVTFTVPLSHSTASNVYPDGIRHTVDGTGIGDINLMGNFWLGTPGKHPKGNLQLGLGVKAPTGRNHVLGNAYDSLGNVAAAPIPQTVQPGDGGWAVLTQAQAFQQLFSRASAYFTGFYSISLRQHTDVLWAPANALWAVPDVYTARLGLSYALKVEPGLVLSLGGRVDGTPTSDLIGGRTDYFRHAGYTVYVDPGLSVQLGRNQFTLNVPVRVRHTYFDMIVGNPQVVRPGIGGVADYVIYAGYTRRM
jgi:hypothetical protein